MPTQRRRWLQSALTAAAQEIVVLPWGRKRRASKSVKLADTVPAAPRARARNFSPLC